MLLFLGNRFGFWLFTLHDPVCSQKPGSYSEPMSGSENGIFCEAGRKSGVHCLRTLNGSCIMLSACFLFCASCSCYCLASSVYLVVSLVFLLLLKGCSLKKICGKVSIEKSNGITLE